MPTQNKAKKIGASQDFVPIKEVKDGLVILDNGTIVSISLVTSVNISLKSPEEQNMTIAAFQAFVNILEFPVQISVQSRKLDIEPYLELLEKRLKDQTNDIIKLQTIEYISFIKNFSESVNIMDKQFFLVVSYKPHMSNSSKKGIFSFFSKKDNDADLSAEDSFNESRSQVEQRSDLLNSALARTGVKIKRLDTESVLEVFYKIFNPGSDISELEKHEAI